MTFAEIIALLKKRLALLIIVPALVAAVTGWYCFRFMPDTYTASTTLYILIYQDSSTAALNSYSGLSANMSVSEQIANDVSQLIMSKRAQLLVEDYLEDDAHVAPYEVVAYCDDDSRIMNITVTSADRSSVADVANALSRVAAELAHDIMNVESINVIDWATAPRAASGPNRAIYMVGAAGATLFVLLVLVLVAARLDTRVRTLPDAERASGFPTVGRVPYLKTSRGSVRSERRVADANARAVDEARDAVQTALTNLFFVGGGAHPCVITVASPGDEEGRSTLACIAAQTLAASGNSVLIMEGDLNNRSLADMLDIHPEFGLSAVLDGTVPVLDAIRSTKQQNLWFLDVEPTCANPTGLFSSKGFRATLELLREKYDFIIIDTPPATAFVYAAVLASLADATLVVAKEGVTRRSELRAGGAQLRRAGVSSAGVVLNFATLTRAERRQAKRRERKRRAKAGKAELGDLALRENLADCAPGEGPQASPQAAAEHPVVDPRPDAPDAPKA